MWQTVTERWPTSAVQTHGLRSRTPLTKFCMWLGDRYNRLASFASGSLTSFSSLAKILPRLTKIHWSFSPTNRMPLPSLGSSDARKLPIAANQLDAIGVGVGHLEGRMAVVAVGLLGRGRAFGLDRDRAAAVGTEAPLGDVVVMGAPVGHLAAGVFVPPAEFVMAALLDVIDLRRRAQARSPSSALPAGPRP